MRWIKKGLIFKANGEYGWIKSHAQIPTVLVLEDRLRVYFATRPEIGLTYSAMMDLDIKNPQNILKIYDKPVLTPGEEGHFDEHGAMPNFVYRKDDGEIYFYYAGWSRRTTIPYSNWEGLAVSNDNGLTFEKMFIGPVMDRTRDEIYSALAVNFEKYDGEYYGNYVTGTKWIEANGKLESMYEIVFTKSKDLINWERNTTPLLPTKLKNEANTRPSFIKINDTYHMWFCYRGIEDFRDGKDAYRIGYAYSKDLKNWTRDDDNAGIEVSPDGWDSKMLAYPYVVKTPYGIYMFYNGNGFGQSGFGYAVLEE
ncbi:MAG: hypothetical protein AB7U85_04635 [Alphaproteobacteria bacterium]